MATPIFRPTDGPNPNTTPGARADRLGSPSLAKPLGITAVVVIAAIAVTLAFALRDTESDAPVEEDIPITAAPTSVDGDSDGGITGTAEDLGNMDGTDAMSEQSGSDATTQTEN